MRAAPSMIVAIADPRDLPARRFVDALGDGAARLLTPGDLASPGWRFEVGDAAGSMAVVDGRPMRASEVSAIVTRLARIDAAHLPQVAAADRDYVACEMTAFLLAWLASLPCRQLNPPSAPSLCGPMLPWSAWIALAAQVGVRAVQPRRSALPDEPAVEPVRPRESLRFDIVGERVVGPDRPDLATSALRLARLANVAMLGVDFVRVDADFRLGAVDPWPDVSHPDLASALVALCR